MTETVLDKIAATKKQEIAAARSREPEEALRRRAEGRPDRRPLVERLRGASPEEISIIAEIKRASPSRGIIRASLDAADYAARYEAGGAAAISVLTDVHYFRGSLADLREARQAVSLPVLRKDFLISSYQLYESAAAGADAVLLIVRLLETSHLKDLMQLCRELRMEALVEIHDERELDRANLAGAELVGINNRDLRTFKTDTAVATRLASRLTDKQVAVAASGISDMEDIRRAGQAGISNFLIGESLVRARDTIGFLRRLVGG